MNLTIKQSIIFGLLFGLVLCLPVFFFFGLNMVIFEHGDKINNLNYGYMIEEHVKKNKLNMPFPNYINLDGDLQTLNTMHQDFDAFYFDLVKNYKYTVNEYDCKYWTYVWLNYYIYNKDRYNWEVKLINTNNHIYLMVYNDSQYCTLDQIDRNCINFIK